MYPLAPTAWLTAPPLFTHPSDAGRWLEPAYFTQEGVLGPHKDRRLGRQFEDTLMAQVARQPSLTIVERNLPIRADGRTLGEFDAIVWHKPSQQWWHWEITFKHYLGIAKDFWPGPNPHDHFHRKYEHGLTHQFPLAHHPLAQAALPGMISAQHLFSRGVLYYPGHYDVPAPNGAHPQHLRGTWWPAEQLPSAQRYLILHKSHWLNASNALNHAPTWLSADAIIQHVHAVNCPTLVLSQYALGRYHPTFVVPNNWISHAQTEHSEKAGQ